MTCLKTFLAHEFRRPLQASSELQKLFGLPDHENLVEEFKCKLLQTYSCGHNSVTPAIQMAFQGTLYITDRHTAFTVEERGRKLPFKVEAGRHLRCFPCPARAQRPLQAADTPRGCLVHDNSFSLRHFIAALPCRTPLVPSLPASAFSGLSVHSLQLPTPSLAPLQPPVPCPLLCPHPFVSLSGVAL